MNWAGATGSSKGQNAIQRTIARVAAVDRDQLLLVDQTSPFRAKLAGSYLHRHRLSHELPCVGDWVCLERQSGDDFGVVKALLERRTSLRRKSAGNVIEYKMIAANVDYVVIVQWEVRWLSTSRECVNLAFWARKAA